MSARTRCNLQDLTTRLANCSTCTSGVSSSERHGLNLLGGKGGRGWIRPGRHLTGCDCGAADSQRHNMLCTYRVEKCQVTFCLVGRNCPLLRTLLSCYHLDSQIRRGCFHVPCMRQLRRTWACVFSIKALLMSCWHFQSLDSRGNRINPHGRFLRFCCLTGTSRNEFRN